MTKQELQQFLQALDEYQVLLMKQNWTAETLANARNKLIAAANKEPNAAV